MCRMECEYKHRSKNHHLGADGLIILLFSVVFNTVFNSSFDKRVETATVYCLAFLGIEATELLCSVVKSSFFKNDVSSDNVAVLFKCITMFLHKAPHRKLLY